MLTILIADDHSAIRIGMKLIVQNVYPSAQIDHAENAADVVDKMKQQVYDLILLDINMPDSDPFGLMGWINSASLIPGTHLFYERGRIICKKIPSDGRKRLFKKRVLQKPRLPGR